MSTAYTSDTIKGIAKRSTVALGLLLGALATIIALSVAIESSSMLFSAVDALSWIGQSIVEYSYAITLFVSEIGFLIPALGFLAVTDRSIVSISRPDSRALRIGAGALSVAVGAEVVRLVLTALTAVGSAGTLPTPTDVGLITVGATVVATVVIAPPAEELLFRGIIQRYLSSVSSWRVGVAVATLFFVSIHAPALIVTATNAAGAVLAIVPLIALSVGAGVAYVRTDNLAIPIAVHGVYNATLLVMAAGMIAF